MTVDQVVSHFGSAKKAADFLGITTSAVHMWKKRGAVPVRTQCLLEVRTAGKLRARVGQQTTHRGRVKK